MSSAASAYFHVGEFERTIRDYDEVLELEPKFINIYAALWHNVVARGRMGKC